MWLDPFLSFLSSPSYFAREKELKASNTHLLIFRLAKKKAPTDSEASQSPEELLRTLMLQHQSRQLTYHDQPPSSISSPDNDKHFADSDTQPESPDGYDSDEPGDSDNRDR